MSIPAIRSGTASAIILAMALLLMSPGIWLNRVTTDSGLLNISWLSGFAAELASGNPYPRWLPEVNDGLGSPVFFFYAPLPFYLTAPFVWLLHDPVAAVVLGSTVMLALSGISAFVLFRDFLGSKESLLLAIAYMAMPYHFMVDIWVRGTLGEQASFIFVPLGVLCLRRLDRDLRYAAGLALAAAGQAMSHIPSTLLFGGVFGFLSIWMAVERRSFRFLAVAALSGFLGVAAAAIYLLPANAARTFIRPEFWAILNPGDHYLFKFTDRFDLAITAIFLPSALLYGFSVRKLWNSPGWAETRPWAVLGAAIILLVSPFASPLWRHAGIFEIIQFPWRMLEFFDLAVCMLLALALKNRTVPGKPLLRCLIYLCTGAIAGVAGNQLLSEDRFDSQSASLKPDAVEYLPRCNDFIPGPDQKFWILTSSLLLEIRKLPMDASTLRLFYYPFLQAEVDGKILPMSCQSGTGLAHLDAPFTGTGTIRIVPKPLPVERPALLITIAGLILIALLGLLPVLRRRLRSGKPQPDKTPGVQLDVR